MDTSPDAGRSRWSRLCSAGRTAASLAVSAVLLLTVAGAALWVGSSLLGYERYVITGGSMDGTIEKGSVVLSKPTPVADLAVGDVVTYLPPPESGVTTLVTHRITALRTGPDGVRVLRTRGDANADADPWRFSLAGDVQPVVVFHLPYVGRLVTAVADRDTRMLVVGLPAALVALVSLGQLVAALRPARRHTRVTERA